MECFLLLIITKEDTVMTALLVILTIMLFVLIDAVKLHFERKKANNILKDPGAVMDPTFGLCMCDGGERIEEEKKDD
jgi:hypothetical protein